MTPRAGISGWRVRHPIATALLTLASLLLGLLAFLRQRRHTEPEERQQP
ncbi:hypothetical protein, partial [Pseudomonas aeruginosa]